ncbi:sulfiredoxin, chloroplastic/mitochondrial-like isoform X3 [Phragmites australis]|uniref:sulfiredoxin, chloroplastic/mitochondrial-like isoform X3 n=1 Tax=Phragmites australis TaxID=29695 RepID=UPI002D768E14|nr:sulfiredoxin, chloroplastic/mitochondrial-like isoform X3 [Phragmites australis]
MASSSSLSLAKTMASGILLHRRAVPNASFLRGTGRIADAGRSKNHGFSASSSNGAAVPSLTSDSEKKGPVIMEIPLDKIRRPLMRTRANDPAKVQELMDSIRVIGLQVPIDVLEVDGVYYGFSGCHRYEAHQRLGLPTIRCKVRRGTKETLRHHMR